VTDKEVYGLGSRGTQKQSLASIYMDVILQGVYPRGTQKAVRGAGLEA
jgi:hypothetical protein